LKITIEKNNGEIKTIKNVKEFILLADDSDGILLRSVCGLEFMGYAAAHIQAEFTDALKND